MKKSHLIAAAALLCTIIAAFAIHSLRVKSSPPPAPSRLTIHFTCDTAGRLEPCGCFTGQHGGLTRLRTWLSSRKNPALALNLDVGGAIAGPADYDVIQHPYLSRAYSIMGFKALNIGSREASLPAATLLSLSRKSPVPLISASVVDPSSRNPILPPYTITSAAGLRIGIIGVVSPRSVPNPGPDLTILSLNEAIDRHLPELLAKSDLIILLAFASDQEIRLLASDYFEFAVILGGDVQGPSPELIRENDSLIAYTTNQARSVGTISFLPVKTATRYRTSDPAYSIDLLEESIPQHPDIRALVESYRTEIRNTPLAVDAPHQHDPDAIPGVSPTATYVGSSSCKQCHPRDHQIWENSGHARAFQTLVSSGSDADPHCVKCHTVGFGKPGGYRRPLGATSLTDVSCESCHGPAAEHLAKHLHGKPSAFTFRPLGPGDCTSCHYGEFSRPFEWDTFWPPISHGKNTIPAPR